MMLRAVAEREEAAASRERIREASWSAEERRQLEGLFEAIDVDGSGTLDFQEFTRLMSDLESAREQGSSGGGDERGAIFRQAAAALQTRRCVSDFIEQWTGRDGGRAKRHAFK